MTQHLTRTIAAAVGAVAIAFCVGPGSVGTASGAVTGQASPRPTVDVGDNFYKPMELEVPAGTKVTWKNTGRILHNVVPVKGDKWGTKALSKGKSYSYRFKKPGKYAYYCTFHGSATGGQRGTVIVTKAAPPTTTTTTTTTAAPAG